MPRIALALVAVTLLTACETVEGFGRDVESAGEAVEREAAEAQQ
jgi:entericidin B